MNTISHVAQQLITDVDGDPSHMSICEPFNIAKHLQFGSQLPDPGLDVPQGNLPH